jgi:acyl-CoA synthetase (AMP-forming)/AMP-acid ligase II
MTLTSPFADVEIPDTSLHGLLLDDVGDLADEPALIDGLTGLTLTFGQVAAGSARFAAALAERGIGKGDVVAIFSPNNPYYAVVFHGILRVGAVATTINSLYTPDEIAHQLRDSRAVLAVTVSPFLDRMRAAVAQDAVAVREIVVLDGADGHESLQDLLSTTAETPLVDIDPAVDLAVLPYSSGTTGLAKGVMLTHRNLVANGEQAAAVLGIGRGVRVLAVLPFFHIYGMTIMMNLGLRTGATVVTMPKFDLADFLRVISEHRVSRVFIAPPVAVALAKHPMVDDYDLSVIEVLFSGAAPLDADLASLVAQRLGCRIRQGYGMTELSPLSHAIPIDRDDISPGTVGLLAPNMQARLVDPGTGEDVTGHGEPGELWLRGPNVMVGYLNNAEATAITLDADGWLHTGDVATVDADGVYTIVDRVKELIKYKGYQVPPAELEALLLSHPAIADAAVIGVRDADGEEVPKAFVVRQPDTTIDADAVMTFVADHVAPYKKVRVVEFIEAIPKSASGKILRKDLRVR